MNMTYIQLPCVKCRATVMVYCDTDNLTKSGHPKGRGAILCKEHVRENNRRWRGRTSEDMDKLAKKNVNECKVFKAGDPEFEKLAALYRR